MECSSNFLSISLSLSFNISRFMLILLLSIVGIEIFFWPSFSFIVFGLLFIILFIIFFWGLKYSKNSLFSLLMSSIFFMSSSTYIFSLSLLFSIIILLWGDEYFSFLYILFADRLKKLLLFSAEDISISFIILLFLYTSEFWELFLSTLILEFLFLFLFFSSIFNVLFFEILLFLKESSSSTSFIVYIILFLFNNSLLIISFSSFPIFSISHFSCSFICPMTWLNLFSFKMLLIFKLKIKERLVGS